ncbi:MAG TPA: TonB-dependent receptor [Candidatus Elarobacter sp.]|jgi:outer membrane receptor protein involved in Fe transport|nr:TonB-dependent receptor [Candidatus Elarobacter sp.]
MAASVLMLALAPAVSEQQPEASTASVATASDPAPGVPSAPAPSAAPADPASAASADPASAAPADPASAAPSESAPEAGSGDPTWDSGTAPTDAAAAPAAPAAPAAAAPSESAAVSPATRLAQAAPTTAVVQGTVKTASGAPVAGASVKLSGPATATATTDANGAFTVTVPPGIYRIDVTRGGYVAAVLSDFAVVAGTTVPVSVTMNQADLSSLQTIGRVSTVSRGSASAINTGTATSSYLSGQAFTNLGNPQINDVLQHLPDVTIQHMGSQQDTAIIVGGVQPYETQVLIDGHPLALGQYGVWVSQYFPSYLIGGVETQSGPGNTTPFANIAVGGTVNLLTPGFTRQPTYELTTGVDNYSTQFTHFLATGSAGKLQYVIGAGTDGYNGPYYQTRQCDVSPQNDASGNPNGTGIIQFCGDASGSFFSKGELLKLRYDLSRASSLEAGFVGAWGGYSPQGTAWGTSLGPLAIAGCGTSGLCTNPNFGYLIGQRVNSLGWYPGSYIYNNQTLFDAQFRTSIGKDTLLVRPYVGNIEPEIIIGTGEIYFPAGFSPPNLPNDPGFIAGCGNAFGSTTNASGGTTVVNGQTACFDSAYSTFELDKLYGTTFSYLHPIGDSLLDLTYDFHGQSTFAYVNNPQGVSVPLSTDRYATLSLTGDLHLIRNLGIDVGLYDTRYTVVGVKPVSLTDATLVGFTRTISRFDPHLALTLRPSNDVSYRASWGTSTTFPYVGQLSGLATYEQPAQSLGVYALGGSLTEKNANLKPEVAIAYDVGVDKRFKNGSVVSLDLQDSVIHDVFEELTTSVPANGGLEGIFSPINAAKLSTQLATLKYRYAPRTGIGYNLTAAAERSIVQGLPPSLYTAGTAGFPVNNVQICGNGVAAPGIPTCLPYLKGYAQLTYSWRDGTFAALGVDYEGKNNAYFQPPFTQVDLTLRRPVTKSVEIQIGVQNLLNTNNFGTYLPTPGAGTPIVAGSVDAAGNEIQTSFIPSRIPASPRIIRAQVRFHSGR